MGNGAGRDRLRKMSFQRCDCAIACALDVIGDKWTLLIIRDLFIGRSRYGEFLKAGKGSPRTSSLAVSAISRSPASSTATSILGRDRARRTG
jgi:DNA-binding HxlR family transcriptional regulator